MTSRDDLQAELELRLGDPSNSIWSTTELEGYLNFAIKGLYPSFYKRNVDTTTAGAGPLQTAPSGANNLYNIAHQRSGSTRARPLRVWTEGDGEAFIPRTGITGDTLVWSWTSGYDAPATGAEALTIPFEAEEIVVLRAQISALEAILADRVSTERFIALSVREGTTEDDIANTLDALHASLRQRLESSSMTLPEVKNS